MRRALALLILAASPAWAQVDNPSRLDLREEGTTQGRIFALNCVGAELLCAVTGGVGSITFSGGAGAPFADTTAIVKGSADATKLLRFEVDGFTTGTTRVLTPPDRNGTLHVDGGNIDLNFNAAGADVTNSFGAVRVVLGNDGQLWLAGGNGNGSVKIMTNSLANGAMRAYYVPLAKALTAATATPFVQVSVPSGTVTGGTVEYTIRADDGTDFQSRSGVLVYAAVNKAGVETCTLGRPDGGATVDNTTDIVAVSAGTLTNTFTCVVGLADAVQIAANAASSLTETTLNITYAADLLPVANDKVVSRSVSDAAGNISYIERKGRFRITDGAGKVVYNPSREPDIWRIYKQ